MILKILGLIYVVVACVFAAPTFGSILCGYLVITSIAVFLSCEKLDYFIINKSKDV